MCHLHIHAFPSPIAIALSAHRRRKRDVGRPYTSPSSKSPLPKICRRARSAMESQKLSGHSSTPLTDYTREPSVLVKLVTKCLHRRLKWHQKTGQPIRTLAEQYPLAISDNKGNPIKGQKSNATKYLENRYKTSEHPE